MGVSFIECGERQIIPNIKKVVDDLTNRKLESQRDSLQILSAIPICVAI